MNSNLIGSSVLMLNCDELLILNDFFALAKEAKEASKLIKKAYAHAFGVGEKEIEVWHDRDCNNYEYLTHNGVWKARYLHQQYDVDCTPDGIFEVFKADYLVNAKYTSANSDEGRKAEAARYFRSFLRKTQQSLEE